MDDVYQIAPSRVVGRWMVVDTSTGAVVRVGERQMRNLTQQDAGDLAELLNSLNRVKQARLH